MKQVSKHLVNYIKEIRTRALAGDLEARRVLGALALCLIQEDKS